MTNAILQEFLLESFENLSNISDEITAYEKNAGDKELLNAIFRKVHTLKGSAGFLGFSKLQAVTHAAESLLDLMRENEVQINSKIIDVLLESFDVCIEILKTIEDTSKEPTKDYSAITNKLKKIISNKGISEDEAESSTEAAYVRPRELAIAVGAKLPNHFFSEDQRIEKKAPKERKPIFTIEARADVDPNMAPYEMKVEPAIAEAPLAEVLAEVLKVEPIPTAQLNNNVVELIMSENTAKNLMNNNNSSENVNVNANGGEGSAGSKASSVTDSVVKVNVQLLDKIMNVVGELVLNRNQILQYANMVDSSDLNRLSQQLNTITSELQADIMTTRMQPVGSVLSKFERIVRDLARSQGKKIKLEIVGKDTELDKTLLEAIRDPLTHLIRNSVDHGIEMPDVRRTRGKSEEGKIVIRSFHEGGQVSIEIKDDGNGIDPQKIMAKAIQKGIITAEQGKNLSTKQILNIIFMPGFSTAEQVTNISGRGVGMDVVKSNIEKIGGTVDIVSNVGEGSTFKLKIPLTLAIVPALVVQDRSETFAIPQISLVELVRFEAEDAHNRIEKLYDSEFFRLRGNLIPVFRLSNCLNIEGNKSISDLVDDNSINIVVLNAEGRTYGLIVDLILDTEEIVVKPLSRELKKLSFFAGATIMGDGKVALILDALGFYNFADKGHGTKQEKHNDMMDDNLSNSSDAESQELLLVDLDDDRQYAVPLLLVNRLEEFKSSLIEWTGDQAVVKYGSIPMPLINVEKSLNLKGKSLLEQEKIELIPCVVVKIRSQLYGLVVKEIKDIAVTTSTIFSESVDRKGLLGTVFINDKTITMLDIHSILEDLKIGKNLSVAKPVNKKKRILVVEDSPLYRKVQCEFLEELGYQVVTAVNGRDALELLTTDHNIHLIVTDIEMPIMDGWTFTESIRQSKQSYSNIPIIAVSAKISNKDKERGIHAGFSEHLEKLNKVDLDRSITSFLEN